MKKNPYSLHIGREKETGEYYLCLTDMDTGDIYPLAQFLDPACRAVFSQWMETQGYASVAYPTDEEFNQFLEGEL